MPDRAKKKEKQRLKREEKRARHHKLANISPFKKVELFSNLTACYLNTDWRQRGQAIGFVVREMKDGSLAIASFLVDLWCAGLKDIWARFDLYSDEVDSAVKRAGESMDAPMARVSVEEVKTLLAGSIRFAKQNGFRLPADWQKCLSFIGPIDATSADLTGFGWEGDPNKLHWVAPMHDLRSRLIGCTAEEFLARPNVEYTLEVDGLDDADDDIDEDDDETEMARWVEAGDRFIDTGIRLASEWLQTQGETPHPRLRQAMTLQYCRSLVGNDLPALATLQDHHRAVALLLLETFKDEDPAKLPSHPEFVAAKSQLTRWIESYPNKNDALYAIGAELKLPTTSLPE